jgi:hypothetical protein
LRGNDRGGIPQPRRLAYPPVPQRKPGDSGHSLLSKLQKARPPDLDASLETQRMPVFEPGAHSCAPTE